jgi:hypothetical protein
LGADKKSWGWKRIFLLVVVIVVTLVLVWSYLHRAGLRDQLNELRDQARKAGRPTSLSELDDWYDKLSKDSESQDVYLKALKLYNKIGINDETLLFAGDANLPALRDDIPKDVLKMSEKYLNDNKKAVATLKEASKLGPARFNVKLGKIYYPYSMDFRHLEQFREGERLLGIESVMFTQKGEGAKSADTIIEMFDMAKSLDNEPASFSFTTQADCQELAVLCLEWLINKIQLDDKTLKKLAENLKSVERSKSMPKALVGDVCFFTSAYQPSLRVPYVFRFVYTLRGAGIEEKIFVRESAKYVEEAWKKSVIDSLAADKKIMEEVRALPFYFRLSKEAIPQIVSLFTYNAERVALIRLARTVVAIELYRLKYKKHPKKLSALVPEFMESVPIDPFSGKAMRYLDFGDKYIVYSIGEDELDNEGQMKNKFISSLKEEGDIVFSVTR